MTIRVRHPGCAPKDVNLGPGVARRHDYRAEAHTVDDDRGTPAPWMRGLKPYSTRSEREA